MRSLVLVCLVLVGCQERRDLEILFGANPNDLTTGFQCRDSTGVPLIRRAIETGAACELDHIVAIVRETGSLDVTRQAAADEAQRAIEAAQRLPPNECSEGLLQLAAQLLLRRN